MGLNLTEIDNHLQSLEKKELLYLYIMIVGGAFFLSYYFLFESSEKQLAEANQNRKNVLKEIRNHKNYLSFHDDFEILQGRKSIDNLKKEISDFKQKKGYLNSQLSELSNVKYSKESWTEFLNRVSIVASTSGVDLLSMKNQFLESDTTFGNHLNIEIKINSNYINTISFIDRLEKSSLIVDVEMIDMELTEDGVITSLALSVWGIKA